MKRLLQCVVFLLMPVVAIPPALARGICETTPTEAGNMDCCDRAHVAVPAAVSMAVQGCGVTCCSVAPEKWPTPAIPDRFTTGPGALDASLAVSSPATNKQPLAPAVAVGATLPAQDLPVLLHTFRI